MFKDFLKTLLIVLGISFTFALVSCGESEGGEEEETTEESTEEESAEATSEEAAPMFTANAECNISIEGMMCSKGCKSAIEAQLNDTEGVEIAEVNFEEGTAVIAYDDQLITEDAIIESVNTLNEGAYSATVIAEETEEVEG